LDVARPIPLRTPSDAGIRAVSWKPPSNQRFEILLYLGRKNTPSGIVHANKKWRKIRHPGAVALSSHLPQKLRE